MRGRVDKQLRKRKQLKAFKSIIKEKCRKISKVKAQSKMKNKRESTPQ